MENYDNNYLTNYINDNSDKQEKNVIIYIVNIILFTFALFLFSLLLNISEKIGYYNKIAGIVVFIILLMLIIVFFVAPIIHIFKLDYFEIGKSQNTKKANYHNKIVRYNIAKKIINLNEKNNNLNWYDKELVNELKVGVNTKNDEKIDNVLKDLMNTSIKNASNKIIVSCAFQSGLYSALNQSAKIDALLVAFINFKMVKDIMFLYGFRPNTAKLLKIYFNSVSASLAAYGLQSSRIIPSVIAKLKLPIVSSVADVATQAFANGAFTMLVGYKVIDYLKKDYKIQSIIKDVDVLDDEFEKKRTEEEIKKALDEEISIFKQKKIIM